MSHLPSGRRRRFQRGGDASIGLAVAATEPDFAAPGAHADERPQLQAHEALGERFAVGSGFLIAEDDDVAAEGFLHVPGGVADARLEIEPGLAEELAEKPGVDVAAFVVADVDDEALAVVDGIVVALPLADVVGPMARR